MFKLSGLIFNAKKAKNHKISIIILAFVYTSLSIFLSLWIFPQYSSLMMVFLTVISCLYLVEKVLILEEKKESDFNSESWLLKQHFKTLLFLLFLFLGFLLAFTFWTLVLPNNMVLEIFNSQRATFSQIKSISGNSINLTSLSIIISNNIKVMFFSLLFAIFYGAGAIFILVWNASIMGYVIGDITRNNLGFSSLPYAFLKYFIHGIPEMFSYLGAALAGGIIFLSIVKGDLIPGKIKGIVRDVVIIFSLSILLLIISALIESYISPLI